MKAKSRSLGYKQANGGTFLNALNYTDRPGGDNTYLFYDEHTGYDFVPAGAANLNVPVYAAAAGTVSRIYDSYNTVVIDHGNGYQTYYLHMMSSGLIANNSTVVKGQQIGVVGNAGGVSPHLHFTVKQGTARVDPYREGLWD